MSDFLERMATCSAGRAAAVRTFSDGDFDKPVVELDLAAFDIIAEIKERSPAAGALADGGLARAARAAAYVRGGAAAISVLTEPSRFDGDIAHLEEVVAAVPGIPVMRKDFLVDVAQVLEARAAGASGVLLIVAMLADETLRAMLDCAAEHGMFVLLEAFDAEDLDRLRRIVSPADADRALDGRLLFGVNSRDLRTLEVDPHRLERLAPVLPRGLSVAESGLVSPADAATVAGFGYSLALVGTALMRCDDPAGLVAAMIEAGRPGAPV